METFSYLVVTILFAMRQDGISNNKSLAIGRLSEAHVKGLDPATDAHCPATHPHQKHPTNVLIDAVPPGQTIDLATSPAQRVRMRCSNELRQLDLRDY